MKNCVTHFSMDDNSYATSYLNWMMLDDAGMRKRKGKKLCLVSG
jgi:hypothetical protein